MMKKLMALVFGLGFLLSTTCTVFASGFAIIEQSVSGLGNAFAGGAASAEDASTIFFNPAGMTLLDGQQVVGGTHVIVPSTKFSADRAENITGAPNSLGTNNGGDGGVIALVPNLYYTNQINEKVSFGLGIFAPFGLATEYDKDWVGRYHAIESDVMTININPNIAFKVTDKLSLSAGVSAQYIDVTLSSMVDGGLVASSLGGNPLNISNTDYDVLVENTADDWGYGFNLGLMYELSSATRIGLAYRSEIAHKVKGEVKSNVPEEMATADATYFAITGKHLFATQGLQGKIDLPAIASLSLYHQVNDKLAIMGDVTWTGWSSFKELVIEFDDEIATNQSTTTTENWDDSWRYSIGATYQATDKLKVRTGLAYDETPISDEYRTPRIPGTDRLWVSLGLGYQINEKMNIDCAYTHLFVENSKMEKFTTTPEDTARGTVVGEFENVVDIASVQLTYNF
jgi:long-chain fatty acid transport protein